MRRSSRPLADAELANGNTDEFKVVHTTGPFGIGHHYEVGGTRTRTVDPHTGETRIVETRVGEKKSRVTVIPGRQTLVEQAAARAEARNAERAAAAAGSRGRSGWSGRSETYNLPGGGTLRHGSSRSALMQDKLRENAEGYAAFKQRGGWGQLWKELTGKAKRK